MNIEIEAKFLNIERESMRQRLAFAGFTCVKPDCLMRRVVFDTPSGDMSTWGRVRDEGDRITMSIKRSNDGNSLTGTEEIELLVNDFDDAVRLLEACGLTRKAYQETRREVWMRGEVEATIDEWPALPPFCEIEGPNEDSVKHAADDLGFQWDDALFGAVGAVYRKIGIDPNIINKHPVITFQNVEEIFNLAQDGASAQAG